MSLYHSGSDQTFWQKTIISSPWRVLTASSIPFSSSHRSISNSDHYYDKKSISSLSTKDNSQYALHQHHLRCCVSVCARTRLRRSTRRQQHSQATRRVRRPRKEDEQRRPPCLPQHHMRPCLLQRRSQPLPHPEGQVPEHRSGMSPSLPRLSLEWVLITALQLRRFKSVHMDFPSDGSLNHCQLYAYGRRNCGGTLAGSKCCLVSLMNGTGVDTDFLPQKCLSTSRRHRPRTPATPSRSPTLRR